MSVISLTTEVSRRYRTELTHVSHLTNYRALTLFFFLALCRRYVPDSIVTSISLYGDQQVHFTTRVPYRCGLRPHTRTLMPCPDGLMRVIYVNLWQVDDACKLAIRLASSEHMLAYADVCWRMLTYALWQVDDAYKLAIRLACSERMLAYADVC
jgi:hypothetical protein